MTWLENSKIKQLTSEIHFFNEHGIKVSIEVGKRLEEAKTEFPTSDDWMNWTSTEFGYKKSQAYKLVAIAKRFHSSGNSMEGKTISEIYALTAFDDEELETPAELPSGEVKKPIDMSQKEIEQYKQAQRLAEKRADEAEIAQQQLTTEHTQQQASLLAQIEQLKLVKDSPETLKRIAELEAKADREHQLAQDNIKLQVDMNKMEREFAEKITQHDKETQAYSDLRKSLRSIINIVTMEHSNAKQQYKLISGHKEANEAVQDFIKRFDPLVQDLFKTWRGVATLSEEVIVDVRQTGATNSGIIEITGGEG